MAALTFPALGLFELESLARGVVVADALVKQAAVQIVVAEAVSPGKYLLIFVGPEGEVVESFKAGLEAGGAMVLDSLHLPHLAEAVVAVAKKIGQRSLHLSRKRSPTIARDFGSR